MYGCVKYTARTSATHGHISLLEFTLWSRVVSRQSAQLLHRRQTRLSPKAFILLYIHEFLRAVRCCTAWFM